MMKWEFEGTGHAGKMKGVILALADSLTGEDEHLKISIKVDSGLDKHPLLDSEKGVDKKK